MKNADKALLIVHVEEYNEAIANAVAKLIDKLNKTYKWIDKLTASMLFGCTQ